MATLTNSPRPIAQPVMTQPRTRPTPGSSTEATRRAICKHRGPAAPSTAPSQVCSAIGAPTGRRQAGVEAPLDCRRDPVHVQRRDQQGHGHEQPHRQERQPPRSRRPAQPASRASRPGPPSPAPARPSRPAAPGTRAATARGCARRRPGTPDRSVARRRGTGAVASGGLGGEWRCAWDVRRARLAQQEPAWPQPRFDLLGIGNAIVDVVASVEDDFLVPA